MRSISTLVAVATVAIVSTAQAAGVPGQGTWEATLKARDINGVPLASLADPSAAFFYDTALNVTWLADWNQAGTAMNWGSATAWAATLAPGGFTGWRLPFVVDTGSVGCNFSFSGGTDCGYNVQTKTGATAYSELAYMFHVELGNKAYYAPGTGDPQPGYGLTNSGPFKRMQADVYWTGTEYQADSSLAWFFETDIGQQTAQVKTSDFLAVAVRAGDVAAVPEPQTVAMIVAGLAVLGLAIRRRPC